MHIFMFCKIYKIIKGEKNERKAKNISMHLKKGNVILNSGVRSTLDTFWEIMKTVPFQEAHFEDGGEEVTDLWVKYNLFQW